MKRPFCTVMSGGETTQSPSKWKTVKIMIRDGEAGRLGARGKRPLSLWDFWAVEGF